MDREERLVTLQRTVNALSGPMVPDELRQALGWSQGDFDEVLIDAIEGKLVHRIGAGLIGSQTHLLARRAYALCHLNEGLKPKQH
jgi:bifunctional DNA-binding transcriptional regulator/antitoxin component of YhaV-PrlF toxin-antitoxin module